MKQLVQSNQITGSFTVADDQISVCLRAEGPRRLPLPVCPGTHPVSPSDPRQPVNI